MSSNLDARFARLATLVGGVGAVNELFVVEECDALAEAGHAEAMLLAANVAALGYGREQNFAIASAWLKRAAAAGSTTAQAQLDLVGDQYADWLAPRATRSVVAQPRIGMSDGFLDAATCAWLIERARPLQNAALIYDPLTAKPKQDDARSNSVGAFSLLELDLPTILVRERIANTIGVPSAHFERTSVFRYQTGQTFEPHFDFLQPSPQTNNELNQSGQRHLTFLVYLNDAFDAGETHFLRLEKKLRGGVGDALYFYNVDETGTPDYRTKHEGVAPTRGEKWLLSQFIREKPQPQG